MYDFWKDPKKLQKKKPLWILDSSSILNEPRKNAQKFWVMGKCVSIDKLLIGFKGAHELELSFRDKGDTNVM
jgi:hypothetical protein